MLAKGDVAVSQFEIPLAYDRGIFPAGAGGRRDHDPQSRAGARVGGELLGLVDILVLNETELGLFTGTELRQ